MKSSIFKLLIINALSLMLIACGGGTAGNSNNYIVVENQTLVNLKQVQISEAKLEAPAWIVIYESTGPLEVQGDVNHIIGIKLVEAGEFNDVEVPLDRSVVNGFYRDIL